MTNKNIDIKPYLFSFNSDNADEFKEILNKSFDDFINWRNSFHSEDFSLQSGVDKTAPTYKLSQERFHKYFGEMLNRLHESTPFHSARYLGHMQAERLMPSLIANFATLLYNLNNVCYEGSPITIEMEYEIAQELAKMIGFDEKIAWGHLTGGGTVANIEALWVARNIKYFPLIAKDISYKYNKSFCLKLLNGAIVDIKDLDDYVLLSMPPETLRQLTFDFFNMDWDINIYEEVFNNDKNISHYGMKNFYDGKILVSATKHYSWPKAAEILGFGRKNTVLVDVDKNFRMEILDLRKKLEICAKKREPVVAVVAMIGTTESSSIDYLDKIVETRAWYEREYNASFFIHVDAAYGGYVKSLFLDENNNMLKYEEVKKELDGLWPSKEIYSAFSALSEADSVTVDPHKLGYVPYSAGAVIYKNKVTKRATVVKAPYISNTTTPEDDDLYFGEYILEGSKSGAAASACWLAHKILPLNIHGYGQLLKNPICDAHYLMSKFEKTFPTTINGKKISVKFFNSPDIDILLYAFNIEGNTSLKVFNDFNNAIKEKIIFHPHKPLSEHNYMVACTIFDFATYKNSVNEALNDLNLDVNEWQSGATPIMLFRTTIMTPNLYTDELKNYYYQGFADYILKVIGEISYNF